MSEEKNDLEVKTQIAIDNEAPVESPEKCRVTNSSATEYKIDAKELKEQVSFSKLLKRHGKELIATERSFKCACPFHKDSQDKFYLWSNDSGGKCYSCDWKGDIYAYIMDKYKLGFCEALEKLQGLAKHIQREEGGERHGDN